MPTAIQKHEIPNTNGRVLLFTRPLTESSRGFYQVRIRKKDGTYLHRSTKTNSYPHAVAFAEKLYHDLLVAERADLKFFDENSRVFKRFYDDWFKTLTTQTETRRKVIKGFFERYLLEFFGDLKLERVNQERFNDYVHWRSTMYQHLTDEELRKRNLKKTPSVILIKAECQALRQYLFWCKSQGYCDRVHYFQLKSIKGLNQQRQRSKTMNKEKFRQIRNLLDKRAHYPMRVAAKDTGKSMWKVSVDEMHNAMLARSGVKGKGNFVVKVDGLKKGLTSMPVHYYHRLLTFYFSQIAYFSLVRPSRELHDLKWTDVVLRKVDVEGIEQTMALLLVRKSKKGLEKERYLSRDGTKAIVRWRMICQKFGLGDDNDYVFADPRDRNNPIQAKNIGAAFSRVIKMEGLGKDNQGKNITLYSYARTHGIQMALEKNTLAEVALIADASIRTIEKAYRNNQIVHNPLKYWSRAEHNKPENPKDKSYGLDWIFEELEWERF